MSIEGGSSRAHYVEESFWKRLWTCRLTDYWWWWTKRHVSSDPKRPSVQYKLPPISVKWKIPFVNLLILVEEWKINLVSLAILFHVLCAQHVSDINISIIRSLRLLLNYHIGCLVLSSLCVGDLVRLVLSGARIAGWSTTVLCFSLQTW